MAGSLQYWPRRRAHRRLPRIRSVGSVKEVLLSNLLTYKVGMTTISLIDDSNSPSKGQEVSRACTVLEVPSMEVYGVRFYVKDEATKYKKTHTDILNTASAQKFGIKNPKNNETKLQEMEKMEGITDVALLVAADPKSTGTTTNHPDRFEAKISGKDIKEKLSFAASKLGKELRANEVFKNGEFIDVVGVSKGKGWAGPIKRFGISRQFHKATGKIRHVGTLGAFTPGKVMYTVPMAGQLGYNYRTEHNKRIVKLGSKEDVKEINPKSGFKNYGLVRNDYVIVEGSVPGPAKRIVRLKKSVENMNSAGIKEPKINFLKV
ncbi:MAG: 50S ribosomal protein L3 [Candidatus Marsarchaeota archaeon]|nr:50S ribosomal protein L3 [Candidatus Marsarchaeota archaeon]